MIDLWTMTRWKSLPDLIAAMKEKTGAGENIVLSPRTARMLILLLDKSDQPKPRHDPWTVDLYSEGGCVYRIDEKGEIFQIEAWARSATTAGAALKLLKEQNPTQRYSQRRGGWVEG